MNQEIKICQNCKKDFVIESEDFAFYERIKVPPPTWCPECRNIRRMSWRESNVLYKSTCELCRKPTISIYSPQSPFTIYCRDCWNSDRWDQMAYGREYDFNQPFFLQFRKLSEKMPHSALTGKNIVNSEYSHACREIKNCYLTFWGYRSEDVNYSFAPLFSKQSFDLWTVENVDHAYEAVYAKQLYRTSFAYFSEDCLDSAFLYDCTGCSDCFGCVNLRKQKYRIFNQQLSKEEYKRQMEYWDLGSYRKQQEAKERFTQLILSAPHRFARAVNTVNCSGDILRNAKNCHSCFSVVDGAENCKYIYFGGLGLKDSYDISSGGNVSELNYEVIGLTTASNIFFSVGGGDSKNIYYSGWLNNCSDMFGCTFLKNKKHCILNKQYTPSEYGEMVRKIKKQMDDIPYLDHKGRTYKYGEFFPSELSAFPYNESNAAPWYPKTRTEILEHGLNWKESEDKDRDITVPAENLPDHIKDVSENILKEIIGCAHADSIGRPNCNERCSGAFRITESELVFYRDMNLALPRICSNCRLAQRRNFQNGFRMWHRTCACEGEKAGSYKNSTRHLHGTAPCQNEFETTYAPERKEILYCTDCYKSEFM